MNKRLKEIKILQVTLFKNSKEQSESGNEYPVRILEKGVEMELRNGRQR